MSIFKNLFKKPEMKVKIEKKELGGGVLACTIEIENGTEETKHAIDSVVRFAKKMAAEEDAQEKEKMLYYISGTISAFKIAGIFTKELKEELMEMVNRVATEGGSLVESTNEMEALKAVMKHLLDKDDQEEK